MKQDLPAPRLTQKLRLHPIEERRRILVEALTPDPETARYIAHQNSDLSWAEIMVENAIGFMEIPVGLVQGLVMNGRVWNLPLATEEPSVCAAASFGSAVVARSGGFTAQCDDAIVRAQIFLEGCRESQQESLRTQRRAFEALAAPLLESMTKRGGGLKNLGTAWHPQSQILELWLDVDVRDAMGANLVNTLAEALSPAAEGFTGGRKLMAILSNDGSRRLARAWFSVETRHLARAGFSGEEAARRIVSASILAAEDPWRAVTHNKGIMNGVSALALATGNDTRALEASVHQFAARDGQYRALSRYRLEGGALVGELELPVPLALVGGALGVHPGARWHLAITEAESAPTLGCLAASLGLAQNLAALLALVTEGIQKGHMGLHGRREAFLQSQKDESHGGKS